MIGFGKKKQEPFACANDKCAKEIPVSDVLFVCPNPMCSGKESPLPNQPKERDGQHLFRAKAFKYSVQCPECGDMAWVKACPACWKDLPIATGNSSMVAVIGTSASGKTCFVTGLIHQLYEEVCKEEAFGIGLLWDDQRGLDYFTGLQKTIFDQHTVPEPNQVKITNVPSIQISLSVPVRRWFKRMTVGSDVTIPLVFPDPSGELFQDLNKSYFVKFLRHAQAIILMVDPFLGRKYQQKLKDNNLPLPSYLVGAKPPDLALSALIKAVGQGRQKGKLNKALAVVLTKCDARFVLNPDKAIDQNKRPFSLQGGGKYNSALAKRLSDRVAHHIANELGMHNVVQLAKQNFRHVHFFAASALGGAPQLEDDGNGSTVARIYNPKPSRVEEPLLWVLHQWGYL